MNPDDLMLYDHFVGSAITGILANEHPNQTRLPTVIAERASAVAFAVMMERQKFRSDDDKRALLRKAKQLADHALSGQLPPQESPLAVCSLCHKPKAGPIGGDPQCVNLHYPPFGVWESP